MRAQVFGTPMNADVTPMNADETCNGAYVPMEATSPGSAPRFQRHSGPFAFIGVTSAFIGVPKTCARITPHP
jgi:hypothetical protein